MKKCIGIVSLILMVAGVANAAGTAMNSTTPPAINGADIAFLDVPRTLAYDADKFFAEVSGAGQTKGESFTLTNAVLFNAVTYRTAITSHGAATKVYIIRIGAIDPVANLFYDLHTEQITQTNYWADNSYQTWTFDTPVTLPALPAGTLYGVDVAMKSSTSGWQTGIPYLNYARTDQYSGGKKYTRPQTGTTGSASPTMQWDSSRDREFHLDMTSTTVVDTTSPTLTNFVDSVAGGPIFEDQVQLAYTLYFDEAIDETTIDLADFENLGSGVSLDSIVSITQTMPFPLPSITKVVFGISGTGTLKLGLASTSDITDMYDNTINSPASDDTTITISSGTTPSTGLFYWDGPTTSGTTDGVSQGGTADWDTSTTSWDMGFGFAGPFVWDNASSPSAIFGGSAGTVTLTENIAVSNINITIPNGYVFEGSNMNFAPGALIDRESPLNGTITFKCSILGSPDAAMSAQNASNILKFEPNGTDKQELGVITNPYYYSADAGDKGRVILTGDTTENTVNGFTYVNTDPDTGLSRNCHYGYLYKEGSGTWTINGDVNQGRIFCITGTLFINGKFTTLYAGFGGAIPNGFKLGGQMHYYPTDSRSQRLIMGSGSILAPGNPALTNGVGTITLEAQENRTDFWWTEFQDGSIYEWQVGADATDTVHMMRTAQPRGITLADMVLKIQDAGGTPSGSDQLPVFTYDAGVTVDMTGFGNTAANFDVTELGGSWDTSSLLLADDGNGTIYLTGLSASGSGTMILLK